MSNAAEHAEATGSTTQAGDRPAAPPTSDGRPALAPISALIEERTPIERRDAVTAFAKAYLRRLADDEIAAAQPEQLYGLVRSTFDFVDSRGLQPSVVRLFNPDPVTDGFECLTTVLKIETWV